MSDTPKVGDLVRIVTGGPLMVVKTVVTTEAGTVMVGCALVEQPKVPTIDVPSERLVLVN